jgi:hypothetical protein
MTYSHDQEEMAQRPPVTDLHDQESAKRYGDPSNRKRLFTVGGTRLSVAVTQILRALKSLLKGLLQ